MNGIIDYNQFISQNASYTVLDNVKTYQNEVVQVLNVQEKLNKQQRIITIVQALALVIFTAFIGLAFESLRQFCKQAFKGQTNQITYIRWTSFPEEEILKIVQKDGMLLQYASKTIREKREIVFAAVQQNGLALQFTSDALREDSELIGLAVKQNPEAEKFSIVKKPVPANDNPIVVGAPPLKEPEKDSVKAVNEVATPLLVPDQPQSKEKASEKPVEEQSVKVLDKAPELTPIAKPEPTAIPAQQIKLDEVKPAEIISDRKIAQKALESKEKTNVIRYFSTELKKDFDLTIAAVSAQPLSFEFIDPTFKENGEVIFSAVFKDDKVLNLLSLPLKEKWELILKFLQSPKQLDKLSQNEHGVLCKFFKEEHQNQALYHELVKISTKFILHSGYLMNHAPFVIAAVKHTPWILEYVDERFRDVTGIVKICVKADPATIRFATNRVKKDPDVREEVTGDEEASKLLPGLDPHPVIPDDIDLETGAADAVGKEKGKPPSPLAAGIPTPPLPGIATPEPGASTPRQQREGYPDSPLKRKDSGLARRGSGLGEGISLPPAIIADPKPGAIPPKAPKSPSGLSKSQQLVSSPNLQERLLALARSQELPQDPAKVSPNKGVMDSVSQVTAAVTLDGLKLKDAKDIYRKIGSIVLTAIRQNPNALEFADISLKNNKDFMIQALMFSVKTLELASEDLKKDKDLITLKSLLLYLKNPFSLENSEGIQKPKEGFAMSPDCAFKAVSIKKEIYDHLVEELQHNDAIFNVIHPKAEADSLVGSFILLSGQQQRAK